MQRNIFRRYFTVKRIIIVLFFNIHCPCLPGSDRIWWKGFSMIRWFYYQHCMSSWIYRHHRFPLYWEMGTSLHTCTCTYPTMTISEIVSFANYIWYILHLTFLSGCLHCIEHAHWCCISSEAYWLTYFQA